MLADFHMHTNFSGDADLESTPRRMIETAIDRGLKSICITDHEDIDFPTEGEFIIDFDKYFETLKALQKEYEDKIYVGIGVEFGLQPHLNEAYRKLTRQYPFDFVIGSTHIFDGLDPYYSEYFKNKTDTECYRRAFEIILENIKSCMEFDVMGHLDYVVRYGHEKEKEYSYSKYADLIDEILIYLIQNGKGIEFNTAGFKYGLGFGHPHQDVLKRYRELGGEIITLGSDSHKPEHIAYEFQKALEILKSCGFKNYTEFREREPIFRQLP